MTDRTSESVPGYETTVPARALILSLLALIVAGLAAILWPESLENLSALVWLLALAPSFLFAFYKGWEGAAVGLLVAMILMIAIEIAPPLMTASPIDWRIAGAVTVLFIAASLGAGALAEKLQTRKFRAVDLAYHDALTGLPSRRLLDLVLKQHFALAQRGIPLCAVLFDLDRFKQYNDTHGHAAGDEALCSFAEVLRTQTRESDVAGRFGGEEFLTLLPGVDLDGAGRYAERVRESLADLELSTGERMTVSGGISCAALSMSAPADLISSADSALHAAKAAGRNCIQPGPVSTSRTSPSQET